MKKATRILTILLTLIVAFSCLNIGNVEMTVMAQSKSSKAKKAYARKLARAGMGYDEFGVDNTNTYFKIANLNKNDSIPGLIVADGNSEWECMEVYTYINGKVKFVTGTYSGDLKFYPAKNLIYYEYAHGGTFEAYYYKFNGKKLTKLTSKFGSDSVNLVTGKRKDPYAFDDLSYAPYVYKVKGKKASSKKYKSYVKQLKGNSKHLKVSLVRNTPSNRSKKLGYRK